MSSPVQSTRNDPEGSHRGEGSLALAADAATGSGASHHPAAGSWAGFSVRDIVFLAVSGVLVLVFSALTSPLHALGIFGLPQMLVSPFFSFFLAIGVMKVRKPGSASIITLVSALLALLMRPASGLTALVTGLVAELVVMIVFRSYRRIASIVIVAALVPMLMVPVQILYYLLVLHVRLASVISFNAAVGGVLAATVILSILGALAGTKVARELISSGRMK